MTSCLEENTSRAGARNWSSDHQLKHHLEKVEKALLKRLKELEKEVSEGVLAEDLPPESGSLLDAVARIDWALKRCGQAEEFIFNQSKNLQQVLKGYELSFQEIQMERDVLLERVHSYLETNSSLRVRLEEQRCQNAVLQRRLDGDLDSQIRTLEADKKRLSELTAEKDKEIFDMNVALEQQLEAWKSEESSLRRRLRNALQDKQKLEENRRRMKEDLGAASSTGTGFRRWKSEGNLELLYQNPNSLDTHENCLSKDSEKSNYPTKTSPSGIPQQSDGVEFDNKSNGTEPVLQAQLNAVKSGLVNVTQKLKVLKLELNPEDVEEKPRRLKRKAEPLEDPEDSNLQQSDPGCKNLKEILEDAKSLNARLLNLREEKQKVIEISKKENDGVQVETNKMESWSQTGGEDEASLAFRNFQKAIGKLKSSVLDCEEKLDEGLLTKDEAVAALVSAFSACISGNSRNFHESEKTALNSKMDTRALMEEEELKKLAAKENGGGDNLLKKKIAADGVGAKELKVQIARLKLEIERLPRLEE